MEHRARRQLFDPERSCRPHGCRLWSGVARRPSRPRDLAVRALEDERFAELPPYPFARGFLRVYAEAVGLDPDPLIDRLRTVMGPGQARSQARRLEPVTVQAVAASRARRLMISGGAVALVVLAGLAVYFAKQLSEFSRPVTSEPIVANPGQAGSPRTTTGPSTPESAPGAAVPSGNNAGSSEPPGALTTPGVGQGTTAAQPPVGQPEEDGIVIEVRASGRCWIRVVADGQMLFEGIVTAGETRKWHGRGPMTVRLGNAGGVELTVNGKFLGVLGQPGEVVSRTFSKDDVRSIGVPMIYDQATGERIAGFFAVRRRPRPAGASLCGCGWRSSCCSHPPLEARSSRLQD